MRARIRAEPPRCQEAAQGDAEHHDGQHHREGAAGAERKQLEQPEPHDLQPEHDRAREGGRESQRNNGRLARRSGPRFDRSPGRAGVSRARAQPERPCGGRRVEQQRRNPCAPNAEVLHENPFTSERPRHRAERVPPVERPERGPEVVAASRQHRHQQRQRGSHRGRRHEQEHEGQAEPQEIDRRRAERHCPQHRGEPAGEPRQHADQRQPGHADRELEHRIEPDRRPRAPPTPRDDCVAQSEPGHEARQHDGTRDGAAAERQPREPEPEAFEDQGGGA